MDYLLPGRGQAWVRYEPQIQSTLGPDGMPMEEITYEQVKVDHIAWDDFLHNPTDDWSKIRWVAKRALMTRDQLVQRFGPVGEEVALTHKTLDEDSGFEDEGDLFKRAEVWEVWDKESKAVYWVSLAYDSMLDAQQDPLKLKNFFPCPRPILANRDPETLIPYPDYHFYRSQAEELDKLTRRITALTRALRVVGVYNASRDELSRLFDVSDNTLIPSKDWVGFLGEGGTKGNVEFLPIGEVAQVLTQLYDLREQVKRDLYEITGISDIIRGYTSPAETATAQQIKGQFASIRIQERQQDVQRFVRDIVELVGEVVSSHFQPQTIALMAGAFEADGEMQQLFQPALQLLRSDSMRCFRIDIETDSTIAFDEERERKKRVELLSAAGSFISNSLQLAQQSPAFTPALGEMLMFGFRGFKTGRSLEPALEQAIQAAQQQQQQAAQQPPQPDPLMLEVQNKAQQAQMKFQQDMQKMQMEAQLKASELNTKAEEVALKQKELELKERELMLKEAEAYADIQLEREKLIAQSQLKQQEIVSQNAIKREELLREMAEEQNPKVRKAIFTTDEAGNRVATIADING